MKPLRVVNLILLYAVLTGGLITRPAPTSATQAQTTTDCAVATGLSQTECEALVALYNATGGINWNDKTGWLQTTMPCTWYGVTCEAERVTRLSLTSNNLNGALPPEIGNLSALKQLYLWDNILTVLPPEIGGLTALESLVLDYNALSVLPPEIGDLTALRSLSLSRNTLTALPPEIGNLSELYTLYLGGNVLTTLPLEISNLSELYALYLGNNTLTTLPPEIGNLIALTELCLSNNALTALPPAFSNLTNLWLLYLNGNPFRGIIPEMLTALTSLQHFTFYNTAWCVPETGPVPAWLANIEDVEGTGQICEQTLGSLQGTVTHPDTTPAAGVQVNLYRPIEWSEWGYVTTTHTLTDGSYQIDDLGQGIDYRVQFVDPTHIYAPEYYDNQPTLEQSTSVTITLGMTRTGIDAMLSPAVVKSATPAITVLNDSILVYQLDICTDIDTTLHLYDPLESHLTWQGFVGAAPDTLTYADGGLTGTIALSASTPFTVVFAVRVSVPPESFVSEYTQVSNTAYYAFPDETLMLAHPSNMQVNIVRYVMTTIYLPLVVRNF